jgi:hypothetical protein
MRWCVRRVARLRFVHTVEFVRVQVDSDSLNVLHDIPNVRRLRFVGCSFQRDSLLRLRDDGQFAHVELTKDDSVAGTNQWLVLRAANQPASDDEIERIVGDFVRPYPLPPE